MKQKYINLYMDWAKRLADLSHARRLKVGAVVVKDDTVISYGYNGTPTNWNNNCEDKIWDTGAGGWLSPEEMLEQYPYEEYNPQAERMVRYKLKTKSEVLHAESNAISKLAKSTNSGLNASIFITHAPCIECAKLIYQSGITAVYYDQDYRSQDGIYFLKKANINVVKFNIC